MRTKRLGDTDLELSRVGLGAWAMGGPFKFGWGPQDDEDSVRTIAEALEVGVNWIDTAPLYGHGRSEEVVGMALKRLNARPIVATKCGLRWDEANERIPCLRRESIVEECENSLKRLGIDVIDLWQMHWNQPNEDLEEGYEAMARCVKAGKVRYTGVSNYNVAELERIKDIHPIASMQPDYSMLHRGCEDEVLGYCGENGIGVVAYSPMMRGLLTGAFTKERVASLPEGDHRKNNKEFVEPGISANLALVEGLRVIAEGRGMTLAQVAVAWVLRRDEVTAAIVGARREGQIGETAPAADVDLSSDELGQIEDLLKQREQALG